jgi:putative nucleotidyltransferase with HDIG domain
MNSSQPNLVRILTVDDEQVILELYENILAQGGNSPEAESQTGESDARLSFELTCCHQGDEAVEGVRMATKEKNPFAVAFIDVHMPPGPDGIWTAEQIRKLDPHTEIVLVTGYAEVSPGEIAHRVPPADKLFYLQKPFQLQEIFQFASALGAKWESARQVRNAHEELENRVRERTIELSRLNEQMKQDIALRERTEEKLQRALTKLRRAMAGIIEAMASTVETRDPYTAGHQRRVSDLARAIAKEMHLTGEEVDGVRMAGVIHDLGKLSVPAEILTKPSRLTENEFTLIKGHPQVGYDILKDIEFPWPVAQIVLQHHERMDSTGYPSGLGGEDIILEARILAVADVVEAMASHRPYRPALGVEKALAEITTHKGKLYDPRVVDACVRLLSRGVFQFGK